MTEDEITYADHVQLHHRGWTRNLIGKFLKRPDRWGSVQHWKNYTGKALFSMDRVMQAESRLDFKTAYIASVIRRKLSDETVEQITATREIANDNYRKWLKGIRSEDVRHLVVAQDVTDILNEATSRGYRTSHN